MKFSADKKEKARLYNQQYRPLLTYHISAENKDKLNALTNEIITWGRQELDQKNWFGMVILGEFIKNKVLTDDLYVPDGKGGYKLDRSRGISDAHRDDIIEAYTYMYFLAIEVPEIKGSLPIIMGAPVKIPREWESEARKKAREISAGCGAD